ncbi:Hypothetical predicted protein [Mytilus galloprovincialis]|uniref:B box-type domain-containing protein n=1 Tax=Mytilus galloprovincialis TaxID=29158 RepID=A0A8B6DKP9_MYTGA|nr:Hypothetical predicted protein [Mytilus galloprovincialis]
MSEEEDWNSEKTESEMSFGDNTYSENGSSVSTNSTKLRNSNSNLMLAVKALKNVSNALTVKTEQYLENHVDILERKTNLEKLETKSQLRDSEGLLKDATKFLINNVKTLRETMKRHHDNIEQLFDHVEQLQFDYDEEQDETKDHESQTNSLSQDEQNSVDEFGRLCDPCIVQKKKRRASYFCENCNEQFCIDCMNFHRVENNNDNHKVGSITSVTLFCAPCRMFAIDVEATVYCIACKDPKPFCSLCAEKHRAMKKTRGHDMSSNLDNLRLRFDQTENSQEWFEVVKTSPVSGTSSVQSFKPSKIISQYDIRTMMETEGHDMTLHVDHLRLRFDEMERQKQQQQWGDRQIDPFFRPPRLWTIRQLKPTNVVKPNPKLIKTEETKGRDSPDQMESFPQLIKTRSDKEQQPVKQTGVELPSSKLLLADRKRGQSSSILYYDLWSKITVLEA